MRKPTEGLKDKIKETIYRIYKKDGRKKVTIRGVAIKCNCSPVPVYHAFKTREDMFDFCLEQSLTNLLDLASQEKTKSLILDIDLALLKLVTRNTGLKEEFSIKENKINVENKLYRITCEFLKSHGKEITPRLESEIHGNIYFIYNFISLLHPNFLKDDIFIDFEKVFLNLHTQIEINAANQVELYDN